ncbi:MAG: hypothetical protein LBL58_15820 [Tannerellaceae bacterium]|nr:hypothetical protein [Tannerellaceae bacterium]
MKNLLQVYSLFRDYHYPQGEYRRQYGLSRSFSFYRFLSSDLPHTTPSSLARMYCCC